MSFFDYIFITIAIVAILVPVFHHFFIRPKSIKRQQELDQLYANEMKKIVDAINETNSRGAN